MIVLDTSVLIRFFTRDDEAKAKKVKDLLESKQDLLLIDAVLLELVFTLMRVYKQSKTQVLKILKFLLSRTNVQVNSEIRKAVKIYEDMNVSITDSLIVVYGEGSKIASFDEKLLKIRGVKPRWL